MTTALAAGARRHALIAVIMLIGLGGMPWASQALAQVGPTYPSRPVRLVVGFPAGSGPDIVARLLAQKLSEGWSNLGVVVDNKPGAAGLIAASEVARAQPDGYTLMLGETGQLAIASSSYSKLPYDPKKDFVPVSQVVTSNFMLVVNPAKVPVHDVRQFVAWSRTQKSLFMGTFGAGTPGHFGAFLFGDAVGLKPEPVHYKTTGDALGGLFGADVAGSFASVGLAAANVKAGKLLALASSGDARSASLPDVPTFREQGYPQLAFNSWFGIVAPARTPPAVVARLEADIRKAVQSAEGKARLEEAGFGVTGTTAREFAHIIDADTVKWGKVVAATGFKAD
ncbi:Bug family tripartite tricarboxylate transporter substrate binding protein [Variovorax boronicumulans]|jgi:tripartite-type tricarboxylate transporter receptor subunit TctC|uniref:Bug family tripartite tricarboxylate transporter substrate binding protein n=1 Tax=Variovorax boronicumulans TaxID=436515 RepID=UPI0012E56A13|nr:tripartite tricarboxylate transporter substrate binding protein [Variovorax boronicumulans]GER15039.1 tripartite tricarboxylate transporter substrate binding protein [Variovorax boronicumulans]